MTTEMHMSHPTAEERIGRSEEALGGRPSGSQPAAPHIEWEMAGVGEPTNAWLEGLSRLELGLEWVEGPWGG